MGAHAAAAVVLVVAEAALAAVGARVPALSAAVLLLAPGLALLPLLPLRVRASAPAALACVPAIGFAASSVALITASKAGLPLNGLTSRVVVAVIVGLGLIALRRQAPGTGERGTLLEWLGLGAAVVLGAVLAGRVVGSSPVPGNDWAQYVLFGDEVRRHGSLAVENPYWMLGGAPFRQDPGVPAVYGAFATMTASGASVLAHGIWVFAMVPILTVFGYLRAYWSPAAAVLGAGLWAALPINHDILAWHGLANVAALGLVPLLMAYATAFGRESVGWVSASGAALVVLALAATHRLSFAVTACGLVLALVVTALRTHDRRCLVRGLLRTGVVLLILSPGVALTLFDVQSASGGTQSYTAYLTTKVHFGPVAADLTIPFVIASLLAVALLAVRRFRSGPLVAPLCVLIAVCALAYSWVVHLPLYYARMAYFLPLALVPLVAIMLVRFTRSRPRVAAAAAIVLTAVIAVFAWGRATEVRRFYAFSNAASLRGLSAVAARLHPGEVVAADRCWSFQATWLLHTRTIAALNPADILPRAEVPLANEAREILAGSERGLEAGRRLGVHYLIVDPTCTDTGGAHPLRPPAHAKAFYVSPRLVVFTR